MKTKDIVGILTGLTLGTVSAAPFFPHPEIRLTIGVIFLALAQFIHLLE